LLKDNKGFVYIIGLLITVLIMCFVSYSVFFKKGSKKNGDDEYLAQSGIDTSNAKTILDTSRKSIKDVEQKMVDRESELLKQLDQY